LDIPEDEPPWLGSRGQTFLPIASGQWTAPPECPIVLSVPHDARDSLATISIEVRGPSGRMDHRDAIPSWSRKQDGSWEASVSLPGLPENTSIRYWLRKQNDNRPILEHAPRRSARLLFITSAPSSIRDVRALLAIDRDRRTQAADPPTRPDVWSGRTFYSLLLDRFGCPGQPASPPHSFSKIDKSDPHAPHGGSLSGLLERLDYLVALGVGAIIISPLYLNDATGYHGYHPLHLLMVEPRFGTLDDLNRLLRAAHDRDLLVILDVVTNHCAPCVQWDPCSEQPLSAEGHMLGAKDSAAPLPMPIELQHPGIFHPPGYTDECRARLFGFLEDYRTEDPYVRGVLIDHLRYWMSQTAIDGFRYDAVRHVDIDFWKHCTEAVRIQARHLGRPHFLQLAEHAGHERPDTNSYLTAGGFDLMLDYPRFLSFAGCTRYQNRSLEILRALLDYFSCEPANGFQPYPSQRYATFLDNQDTSRLLSAFRRDLALDTAEKALHFALHCLILGPQPPLLYYGTEQDFDGACGDYATASGARLGHDVYVREDMFENPQCHWVYGRINRPQHSPYSQANPTFRVASGLARLRRSHRVLWGSAERFRQASKAPITIIEIRHGHYGNRLQRAVVMANSDPHEPVDIDDIARALLPDRCYTYDPASGASEQCGFPVSLPPLSFRIITDDKLTLNGVD
jgi:glycosidase